MTQIDGLIDSAIHANFDVFVFAYDNENYDDEPGCGIEGVSGTPDELERTIWRATSKAEQRFRSTGFYHEQSVPWQTLQKIDLDISDDASNSEQLEEDAFGSSQSPRNVEFAVPRQPDALPRADGQMALGIQSRYAASVHERGRRSIAPTNSRRCSHHGCAGDGFETVDAVLSSPDFPKDLNALGQSQSDIMRLYQASARQFLAGLGGDQPSPNQRRDDARKGSDSMVARSSANAVRVAGSCPPLVGKKIAGKKRPNSKSNLSSSHSSSSLQGPGHSRSRKVSGSFARRMDNQVPGTGASGTDGTLPNSENRKKGATPPLTPMSPSKRVSSVKSRKSVKSVEFFDGAAAASSSDAGKNKNAAKSDKPFVPPRKSTSWTELREEALKKVLKRYQFVPEKNHDSLFIYPSRGNHSGVSMPKAYFNGFRYNFQSFIISSNDFKFCCMSVKSGGEVKLRCPAKIQLNCDTGEFSVVEQHICSQARDLKNAKEEAMKEIWARLKAS